MIISHVSVAGNSALAKICQVFVGNLILQKLMTFGNCILKRNGENRVALFHWTTGESNHNYVRWTLAAAMRPAFGLTFWPNPEDLPMSLGVRYIA